MSADIEMDHVTIRFGDFVAVKDVSVKIAGGEFFSIPRAVGLRQDDDPPHDLRLHRADRGRDPHRRQGHAGIGPNQRPTALIFQNLALFPLMPVGENIAFGLRVRGVPARSGAARPKSCWRCVDLPGPRTRGSASFPAARSSASPSPARWRSSRR